MSVRSEWAAVMPHSTCQRHRATQVDHECDEACAELATGATCSACQRGLVRDGARPGVPAWSMRMRSPLGGAGSWSPASASPRGSPTCTPRSSAITSARMRRPVPGDQESGDRRPPDPAGCRRARRDALLGRIDVLAHRGASGPPSSSLSCSWWASVLWSARSPITSRALGGSRPRPAPSGSPSWGSRSCSVTEDAGASHLPRRRRAARAPRTRPSTGEGQQIRSPRNSATVTPCKVTRRPVGSMRGVAGEDERSGVGHRDRPLDACVVASDIEWRDLQLDGRERIVAAVELIHEPVKRAGGHRGRPGSNVVGVELLQVRAGHARCRHAGRGSASSPGPRWRSSRQQPRLGRLELGVGQARRLGGAPPVAADRQRVALGGRGNGRERSCAVELEPVLQAAGCRRLVASGLAVGRRASTSGGGR